MDYCTPVCVKRTDDIILQTSTHARVPVTLSVVQGPNQGAQKGTGTRRHDDLSLVPRPRVGPCDNKQVNNVCATCAHVSASSRLTDHASSPASQ